MITTFGTTTQSIIALSIWLKQLGKDYLNKDLSVVLLRASEDMKSLNKRILASKELEFPYIKLVLASYTLDTSRGGGRKHTFLKVAKDNKTGLTTQLKYKPIKLGIGAYIVTNSLDDAMRLSHALTNFFPAISFDLEYESGFKTKVKINIESQLTIPPADLNAPEDSVTLETTFILDIIDGDLFEMPSIRKVQYSQYDSYGYNKSITESNITLINKINIVNRYLFDERIKRLGNIDYNLISRIINQSARQIENIDLTTGDITSIIEEDISNLVNPL